MPRRAIIIDPLAPISSWMPMAWRAPIFEGTPGVMIGEWPARIIGTGGARYKAWATETAEEYERLRAALEAPPPLTDAGQIDWRAGPDAAVRSPGTLPPSITVHAPEDGWPAIVVECRPGETWWHRRRYRIEAFGRLEDALVRHDELQARWSEHAD